MLSIRKEKHSACSVPCKVQIKRERSIAESTARSGEFMSHLDVTKECCVMLLNLGSDAYLKLTDRLINNR